MTWLRRTTAVLAHNLFPFDRSLTRGERIFFRIFEVAVLAMSLELAWRYAAYIQRIEAVVLPLGIANYVDVSVFFDHGLSYLLAGLMTLTALLGFLRRSPYAYAVALGLFHLLYASRYSLGEISHEAHFPGMAVMGFAIGTWIFRHDREALPRFVYGFLFFTYGVGYTSAGVCKLLATGLDWPAGAHLALWMGERSVDVTSTLGYFQPNLLQRWSLQYPVIGTAALTFGLVAELAGVLIWFERTRPYVLTALIVMHLGVEVTLNIFFGQNVYMLAMLAYPWGRALDWLLSHGFERPHEARGA